MKPGLRSEQQIFISLSRLLLCIAALWLAHIAPTKDATLRFLNATAKKDRGFKEAQNKEFFSPQCEHKEGSRWTKIDILCTKHRKRLQCVTEHHAAVL